MFVNVTAPTSVSVCHVQELWSKREHRPTGVSVRGAHHDHRSTDPSGLPKAQTVVLLLRENWKLVVGVVNINDHLQENTFVLLQADLQSSSHDVCFG